MSQSTKAELAFSAVTDPGIVRVHNEDSVAISPAAGLAVLADGMGGYNAGEVASGLATALLIRDLEQDMIRIAEDSDAMRIPLHQLIQGRIHQVNHAIFEASHENAQLSGMGTTLVVAVMLGDRLSVAHIGDSRAYRWRGGKLNQITRDHSLLQEQIDAGLLTASEARYSQNRNLVTRALGVDPVVVAEIADFDTQVGDVYLLCSDGLTDMVPDEEIAAVLASDRSLDACANELVQLANDHGGRDNVSVILIRVDSHVSRPKGLMSKMRDWLA